MKITMLNLDFNKAFNLVAGAVLSRGDNAVLKSVLLEVNSEIGKATLRATDGFVEITSWFDCNADESGSFCFDTFMPTIVQNLGEQIVFLLENDNVLHVTSGDSKHDFNIIPGSKFPEKKKLTDYVLLDNIEDFLTGVKMCSVCIDPNASEEYARTYNIDFESRKIITTNRKKVSIYELGKEYLLSTATIIPSKVLDFVLPKLQGFDNVEFCIGDWCGFRSSDFEIVVNTFKLNYPDVSAVVAQQKGQKAKLELMFDIVELRRVLGLCELYEKRAEKNNEDSYTVMRYNKDSVLISVEIKNFSRMSEPVKCATVDSQVDTFEIWFNSTELLKLMNLLTCESVTIHFFENNRAFFVYAQGIQNYTYLQMPFIKNEVGKNA